MSEARRKRVPPLAPDERRAAIIAATLPLLRAEGLNVSTKRIAECAGVAEGTIFRVFADKGALISAVLADAFDPAPAVESINVIATYGQDLRFQLKSVVRLISRRFKENMPLLLVLRTSGLVEATTFPDARAGLNQILDALAELLKPHQHMLRLPAESIARLVMTMVMHSNRSEFLSPDDIVTVVLDGVLYTGVRDADKTSAPPSAAV